MSVPVEYTNAKARLQRFREDILAELVGGRVKAGLDSAHAGMQKYSKVVQALSVTPYLFGEVHRKAVALKMKGLDIGAGKVRGVRSDFKLGEVDYPLQPPLNQPKRKLPQVDVFVYSPLTDLELLEKTNVSSLKSFILLQADSGTFEDTPHAENAVYDYYEFIPCKKWRGEWLLSGGVGWFSTYKHLKGEKTLLVCELVKKGTMTDVWYHIDVWIDATIFDDTNNERIIPLMYHPHPHDTAPAVVFSLAGQRVDHTQKAVYASGVAETRYFGMQPNPAGFMKVANDMSTEGGGEIAVWHNVFDIMVLVNDLAMGTTDPLPDKTYKVEYGGMIVITGYPNSGYKVDHWERDGVTVFTGNPYGYFPDRDRVIKCVFAPL